MATTFAVPDGRVAMAATLYTGTGAGSPQSISNAVNAVSFQPGLVWVKARNATGNNAVTDSVRGAYLQIITQLANAEANYSPYGVTAFNANGFGVNDDNAGNYSVNGAAGGTYSGTPPNYVAWQWKAGGTAVSNTAGTITSSVSANTTAGFSVVTYTGTLSAPGTATVGHGLGVAPAMIITKSRSATSDWVVHHTSLSTPSYAAFLNITAAASDTSAYGTIAASTASVFTTNYVTGMNISGVTTVAYCWAPVAGYSAFGSYTGNGSADGPFVYTGFRPRWILIKSSTVATSWYLLDSARETYNEEKIFLYPDLPAADSPQSAGVDFLSNGFKVRAGAGLGINNSSGGYIYAAFAENPLRYANAR